MMPFDLTPLLTPQIGLIFFHTLVMLCVAFVLKKYAWGPLLERLRQEEKNAEEVQRQEKKARETFKKLQEASGKVLEKAEEKKEQIIERGLAAKHAMLEEARIEIARERANMLQQVEKVAEEKERVMLQAAQKEVATLVLRTSRKLLGMELQKKHTQEVFLQQLIQSVARKDKEAKESPLRP